MRRITRALPEFIIIGDIDPPNAMALMKPPRAETYTKAISTQRARRTLLDTPHNIYSAPVVAPMQPQVRASKREHMNRQRAHKVAEAPASSCGEIRPAVARTERHRSGSATQPWRLSRRVEVESGKSQKYPKISQNIQTYPKHIPNISQNIPKYPKKSIYIYIYIYIYI